MVSTQGLGWEMSAAEAFGMAVEDAAFSSQDGIEGASAEQALRGYRFDDVIDKETGGMYMTATGYEKSFFVEGAKYVKPEEPHRVMVVFSTASSNMRSRIAENKPYLSMDVWESWAPGHTRSGGKGMCTTPGNLNTCSFRGSVSDEFKYMEEEFCGISSLERAFLEGGYL